MLNVLVRFFSSIRRLYWWLIRPETHGVRGLVLNEKNEVLLVRHRYTEGWFLPGGQVRRSETASDALKREVQEETGLVELEIENLLGTYQNQQEYKHDTIEVFVVRTYFMLHDRPNIEIQEFRFFPLADIPPDTSPATRRRIVEYRKESPVSNQW